MWSDDEDGRSGESQTLCFPDSLLSSSTQPTKLAAFMKAANLFSGIVMWSSVR